MSNKSKLFNSNDNIVLYKSAEGNLSFNVNIFDETVWLTQKQMSELFDKSVKTINEHITNSLEERETEKSSTIRDFRIVQKEGKRMISRNIEHYNLDMIISVGYRVKSPRGIQFRKWATQVLKQYMMNGYAINENRIKHIESAIDELVSSQKILKDDVARIKNLLVNLIERPIIIHSHNKINIETGELENKIISLIDVLIAHLKNNKTTQNKLKKAKSDISNMSNLTSKNRVISFLAEIGDSNSTIHKTIKGTKIAKNTLSQLIKLSEKLRNLL